MPVFPHSRATSFIGRQSLCVLLAIAAWSAAAGAQADAHPPATPQPTRVAPPPFVRRADAARDTVRLTLGDVRSRALALNPDLTTARYDVAIARGQYRQASVPLRSNPSAEILGPGGGGSSSELAVTQELELAGQRAARRASRGAGVTRAERGTANTARLVLAETEAGFFRIVAADRRATLAEEVLALNERLAQVAVRQLDEGEISKLDYNLAIIELGRSRSKALSARRDREQTNIALRQLLALPPTVSVSPVLDSVHRHAVLDAVTGMVRVPAEALQDAAPADSGARNSLLASGAGLDELLALAAVRRPDLAERDAAVRQAAAEVTTARREAFPNLLVRAVVERNQEGSGMVVRPGVGIALPVFNRSSGEIDTRRATERQTVASRDAVASQVRADVERAYRTYSSSALEVEVLESTVLGPARENRRLLEAAYRGGKVGLPVLLLIRNQVIDAELEYWSAWLAEREALAELRSAVGTVDVSAVASLTPGGDR